MCVWNVPAMPEKNDEISDTPIENPGIDWGLRIGSLMLLLIVLLMTYAVLFGPSDPEWDRFSRLELGFLIVLGMSVFLLGFSGVVDLVPGRLSKRISDWSSRIGLTLFVPFVLFVLIRGVTGRDEAAGLGGRIGPPPGGPALIVIGVVVVALCTFEWFRDRRNHPGISGAARHFVELLMLAAMFPIMMIGRGGTFGVAFLLIIGGAVFGGEWVGRFWASPYWGASGGLGLLAILVCIGGMALDARIRRDESRRELAPEGDMGPPSDDESSGAD